MLDFQTLFESLPGLYLVFSPDFFVVAGSDAYFQATQTWREDVVGRHLLEVSSSSPEFNTANLQHLRASLQSVLKHRQPHVTVIQNYNTCDPRPRESSSEQQHWRLTHSPFFDKAGQLTHIIHCLAPIGVAALSAQNQLPPEICTLAAHDQAEAAIKDSHERLKLLSEVANDLLVNEDPKAFLAGLFKRISTYLGLEVYFNYLFQAGQPHLQLHTYGGISEEIAEAAKFLELGQGVCGYVVQQRQAAVVENALQIDDALAIPVQSIGIRAYASHPLIVGDRVLGTLGLGTRQRDRFSRDELDLMQVVAGQVAVALERSRLMIELQAQAEALSQTNRIKDEFLAVLSHELRTPLNPILGWSKLLLQGSLNAEKTHMAIATIERNAQLQIQLINNLLDVSRMLRGKITLSATLVNLSQPVLAALETVRLAAAAKSIRVQVSVPAAAEAVMGDAGRLQQVMRNLLSNAVKFTPQGGQVSVTLTHNKNVAQIQVSDTGKGIRADFLPRVFEYFRQEDGATTRQFDGLGLGLAIVRQIVEMHGGTVTVESAGEGLGATFTVKIPLAELVIEPPSLLSSPPEKTDLSSVQFCS